MPTFAIVAGMAIPRAELLANWGRAQQLQPLRKIED
jgi:hypothetical protein